MYSHASPQGQRKPCRQPLGTHCSLTLGKGMPLGPLSHLTPQINKELAFWSSHPAIKCGWDCPMYSEKAGRRGAERLLERWRTWTNFRWLANWNISNGLGSNCLPRRFKVSSLPLCLACAGPQVSGCRQGSEVPSQQALPPGSHGGFTFRPCFLTNLTIFLPLVSKEPHFIFFQFPPS